MPSASQNDTALQGLIDLANGGDAHAWAELLAHACERLRRLARKMLRGYPDLRRWEMTDDLLQNALLRLHRALAEVKPQSVRHFFNLATVQIRRELFDLADHHFGPEGDGSKHHTDGHGAADDEGGVLQNESDGAEEPSTLNGWTDFHARIEALPEHEQEVVGLLWYEGLSQEEAAAVLGVSVRTVKRRWASARLLLVQALEEKPPG
jgi:RNA polymerase sigma-70 factor (ECF subfamily)